MAAAQRPVPFVLRCVCLAGFPQASTYRVTISLRKAKKTGFGDYRGTVGKQSALWVRPGGKLIATEFVVTDGSLRQVVISGDFFLYPEEALATIAAALEGCPATLDKAGYAARVQPALDAGVALLGSSAEAIGVAVVRALSRVDSV